MWKIVLGAVLLATNLACATTTSTAAPASTAPAKSAFDAAANDPTKTTVMIVGGVVAAAGPAVVAVGVATNRDPSQPPVAAFVVGAGLTTAGIATVLAASQLL